MHHGYITVLQCTCFSLVFSLQCTEVCVFVCCPQQDEGGTGAPSAPAPAPAKPDLSRTSGSGPSGGGGDLMGEMSAILARRYVRDKHTTIFFNMSSWEYISISVSSVKQSEYF